MAMPSKQGSDPLISNPWQVSLPSENGNASRSKKQINEAFISSLASVKRLKPSAIRDFPDELMNGRQNGVHCDNGMLEVKEEVPSKHGSVKVDKTAIREALFDAMVDQNHLAEQGQAKLEVKEDGFLREVSDFPLKRLDKSTFQHCNNGVLEMKEEVPSKDGSDFLRISKCVKVDKTATRDALFDAMADQNHLAEQGQAKLEVKEDGFLKEVSDFPLKRLGSPVCTKAGKTAVRDFPDSLLNGLVNKSAQSVCVKAEKSAVREFPGLLNGLVNKSASSVCVKAEKTAVRDIPDSLLNGLASKSSILHSSNDVTDQNHLANQGKASLGLKEERFSKKESDVRMTSKKSGPMHGVKAGKTAIRSPPDTLLDGMVNKSSFKYCSNGMTDQDYLDQGQVRIEVKHKELSQERPEVPLTSKRSSFSCGKADKTAIMDSPDTLLNGMVNKSSFQHCRNGVTDQDCSDPGQMNFGIKQEEFVRGGLDFQMTLKRSASSPCAKAVKQELLDSKEGSFDEFVQQSLSEGPDAALELEKPPVSVISKVERSGLAELKKGVAKTRNHSSKGYFEQVLSHPKALKKKKTNETEKNKSPPSSQMSELCEVSVNDEKFGSYEYGDEKHLGGSGHEEMNHTSSSARSLVKRTLHEFESIRKTLVKAQQTGKRPDLEAAGILKSKNRWRNCENKFIGEVPGIEVGDQFTFRMEMVIVGLHRQTQGGIDFISGKGRTNGQPLATSIVASGCYEDDDDCGDTFIYTGQGGNNFKGNKRQEKDQEMVRGNLALKNSMLEQSPVRVIRGSIDPSSPSDKLYTYDGLYNVVDVWEKSGLAGFKVFQFKLTRRPGQPEIGSSIVRFVGNLKKKGIARPNVLIEDISGGQEKLPVCVVNEVDEEPAPMLFVYISQMKYPFWYSPVLPKGCDCIGNCVDERKCLCAAKNGGEFPYNEDGYLIFDKQVVFECGSSCRCSSSCQNRVSQKGLRYRLEVFKTKNRGWGVRSLNPLRPGGFICEYTGELLSDTEAEQRTGSDEYLFDLGYKCSAWSDVSELMGTVEPSTFDAPVMEEESFTIDAKDFGSVARFVNHSCSPNLFAQNVLYDSDDCRFPHVMLFAMENIPPMRELNYDYNYAVGHVRDGNGNVKTKACYCGSPDCVGRLY